MITLRDKDTGQEIGAISEDQLAFLTAQLEEESPEDTDYYISRDELDVLAEQGADAALITLLRSALGDREGIEVSWGEQSP